MNKMSSQVAHPCYWSRGCCKNGEGEIKYRHYGSLGLGKELAEKNIEKKLWELLYNAESEWLHVAGVSHCNAISSSRTVQYTDSQLHLRKDLPLSPVQDHPLDKPLLYNIAHLLFILSSTEHLLLDNKCSVTLRTYQNLSFVSSNRSQRTLRSY